MKFLIYLNKYFFFLFSKSNWIINKCNSVLIWKNCIIVVYRWGKNRIKRYLSKQFNMKKNRFSFYGLSSSQVLLIKFLGSRTTTINMWTVAAAVAWKIQLSTLARHSWNLFSSRKCVHLTVVESEVNIKWGDSTAHIHMIACMNAMTNFMSYLCIFWLFVMKD